MGGAELDENGHVVDAFSRRYSATLLGSPGALVFPATVAQEDGGTRLVALARTGSGGVDVTGVSITRELVRRTGSC